MHGIIHDFVVKCTVKNGQDYPTGFGGGALISTILPGPYLDSQPSFPKVLDIGSLNINGNMYDYNFCGAGPNWRDIVGMQEFTGLDLIAGPGVTLISNAHKIPIEDDTFDLVLCMNVLEHDTDPFKTILEAYRVLKKGGTCIITCPNERAPEHKDLGGGDTETYNFITEDMFLKWLKESKFKIKEYIPAEGDHLVHCTK